jgi:hypothetical protein
MRGRLARLILALMIYSLIMVPFIMEKPPAELLHALASLAGSDRNSDKAYPLRMDRCVNE